MNYKAINKSNWNKRTTLHLNSDFYNLDSFKQGVSSLNLIELELLGDLGGKKVLHLQCHFGMDSISLARLGAQVTAVDISDVAIEQANKLAREEGVEVNFINCDLYDLPKHCKEKFDLVFTSYGTITWLPDMDRWAEVISRFLKNNGRFVFVEFHPVVWMFDDDFDQIGYSYFNREAIIETSEGTYAADSKEQFESVTWNHSISEVVNALANHNIRIESLNEYDYSPYNCFNQTEQIGPRKFRIKHLGSKIPMVYSVCGVKNIG